MLVLTSQNLTVPKLIGIDCDRCTFVQWHYAIWHGWGPQGAAALWPSTGSLLTAVIPHNVLSIGLTRFSSRAVRAVSYHAQLGSPTIYW
jgi:hypothetical protein